MKILIPILALVLSACGPKPSVTVIDQFPAPAATPNPDNSDPIGTCQKKCKDSLNTVIRICNTTNLYTCGCDND